MTVKGSRLRAVPQLVGKVGFRNRFDVAAQAMAAGTQDVHVQALAALSGPGKGQIGVRVGRILIYVSDRKHLNPLSVLGIKPKH